MYCHLTICGSCVDNKLPYSSAKTFEIEDRKEFTNESYRNIVADFIYEKFNPSNDGVITNEGYKLGDIDLVTGDFEIYCHTEKVGYGHCEWKSWGNIIKCRNYRSKYYA